MQALGIDVYATVKKLGLPTKTFKSKDETPDFYGLVCLSSGCEIFSTQDPYYKKRARARGKNSLGQGVAYEDYC